MLKRSFKIAVATAVLVAGVASGQTIVRTASLGVDSTHGLSSKITVTGTPQTVTLTAVCTQITLNNTSSSETLYFQPFGGNASTSNFPISPGQAFTWTTMPGLSSFSLVASGSSTIGVLAH